MEKYHKTDVAPIERENERDETYQGDNPQIDSNRTCDNYHIVKRDMSYTEFINERIKNLNLKTKPRKDAVIMNSFVISSDGKFFEGMSTSEQKAFFTDSVKFFAEKYGEENIISAIVHMDETTPHLHLNIIPVVDGRLCSKALYDKKKLSILQTEFHEAVGIKYGLERGIIGSTAHHLATAELKAKKIIEAAEKRAAEMDEQTHIQKDEYDKTAITLDGMKGEKVKLQTEIDDLAGLKSDMQTAADEPIPMFGKNDVIKSLRAENVKLKYELDIKNKDNGSLFNLLRESKEREEKYGTAYRAVKDILSVYPDEFHSLLQKSRDRISLKPTSFKSNRNDKGGM